MAVFITGLGNISPQKWEGAALLSDPQNYEGERLFCVEPDYSQYIDVRQLRRMSRILKMGVSAGSMALREAGLAVPDGIITGTGYGCLEDTGSFLSKMISNKEIALNPTPFIQSTHNTIGSQIALLLTCQGYNQTYTQRAFSFENAILDALLELRERPDQSLMVGGVDEITDTSHAILRRFGIFRSASTQSLSLFDSEADGTINGEGATYCILSGQQNQSANVCVDSVATFYQPNIQTVTDGIGQFLKTAGLSLDDMDMVLLGKSGDRRLDKSCEFISSKLFKSNSIGRFKHLSGEYPTATAFAVYLAARIIKEQMIPKVVMERDLGRRPDNILIYNIYFGSYHSLILLRHA